MIIKEKDIEIAADFFTATPEQKLVPFAAEMNTKNPILPISKKSK